MPAAAAHDSTALGFNPRSRTGSDVVTPEERLARIASIHAPARGATAERLGGRVCSRGFNPRSRTGSD